MTPKQALTFLGISIVAALAAHWILHKFSSRVDDELNKSGAAPAASPDAVKGAAYHA